MSATQAAADVDLNKEVKEENLLKYLQSASVIGLVVQKEINW